MTRRYRWVIGLSFAAWLTLWAGEKLANVQGRVQMLDKDASSITVQMKGGVTRKVIYASDTKFLYGHSRKSKPGSWDQLKENYYISCAGTYEQVNLRAKDCVYREAK